MSAVLRALKMLLPAWGLCMILWTGTPSAYAAGLDFSEVFERHSAKMVLVDPATNSIIDVNPAAARFYGYPRAAMRGMGISRINAFTPEQIAEEIALAEREGRNHFVFRHRLASGEPRTVEVRTHPFGLDGRRVLLAIVHDVTPGGVEDGDLWHYQGQLEKLVDAQVKEAQAARRAWTGVLVAALVLQTIVIVLLARNIRRRRALEREREALLRALAARNTELTRLGEVMAHHFQEPARRLVSFAQRLQARSALATDEDARASLGFIDSQARRLSELVRDAQNYLALEQSVANRDAHASSDEALRRAIAGAGEAVGDVPIDIAPGLPEVAFPAERLTQLFGILLENALRYRHPERPLHIRVDARRVDGRVEFGFADNGSGIAPEYREQVFGLFARLVPNSVPGTGMGLALARRLVQLAEGDIHVEDGIDGGTRIVFDLPARTHE